MSTWLFQVLVNAGPLEDGGQKALEYSEQSDAGEDKDELKAKEILKQNLKESRKICCPSGELSTTSQLEMKTPYELCAVIVDIDSI